MSLSDTRRVARFVGVLVLAGLTAGCFQPLYGERPTPAGGVNVAGQLSGVDVSPIDAPGGSRLSRVSVGVRNELIFDLTGGGGGYSPNHRLDVKLSAQQLQVVVDVNSALHDYHNY